MTKQDRLDLQNLIDEAQAAIDKATEFTRDLVEEEDDEDVAEALTNLMEDIDTQLPAVTDYFPDA